MRQKWTDEDGDFLLSSRMTWLDLAVLGMTYVTNILGATAAMVASANTAVQAHYNWQVDVEDFHVTATQDIETIAGGENG